MTAALIPHSCPWITDEDVKAVRNVLASGMIASGDLVRLFERKVSEFLGSSNAIAQSSGTAAISLALKILELSNEDEVILPTYVCRNVLEAVLTEGAKPILCDVNRYGVITDETVAPHVTGQTKAIIAVHIFGHPCDLTTLRRFDVPIIEDACQAFGLRLGGKMAATLGDIGILSFHATKCLTSGEGGMFVTDNDQLARKARLLVYGDLAPSTRHVAPMSDLQAALGNSQLRRYDLFLEKRHMLRQQYSEAAAALGVETGVSEDSTTLFRFTLRTVHTFDKISAAFRNEGIHVRRGVDELLHRTMGLSDEGFPTAVDIFDKNISLPFYPALSFDDATNIIKSFRLMKHDY